MDLRDLSDHDVYRAGRGVEAVAREHDLDPERILKLSWNENPFGPSPDAVDAMRRAAERAHVYPTSSHTDLLEALADRWGVAPEQVWLAPGANGALDYLCRAVLGTDEEILVPDPGFPYYGTSARYHRGRVGGSYPLRKAEAWTQSADRVLEHHDGERIVFVTTPHNPTGSEMSLPEIRTLATHLGEETLLVVDESYGEFSEAPSAAALLDDHENVALLRTFSKAHGLAGVRVGYALVPDTWADAYARVNSPAAVSEPACHAGLAALEDDEHVRRSVETARCSRAYVDEHLDARTFESAANFVLADVGDATAVTEAAAKRGVIVRDCSAPGWNLSGCIRITCGTREGTRRAVETLNDAIAAQSSEGERSRGAR